MAEGAPVQMRRLEWIGSTKKDLLALPAEVMDVFGYALYLAQTGSKHDQAKALRGFGSAGVLEVVEDRRGDTYRAVYTVQLRPGCSCCTCFRRNPSPGSRRLNRTWT